MAMSVLWSSRLDEDAGCGNLCALGALSYAAGAVSTGRLWTSLAEEKKCSLNSVRVAPNLARYALDARFSRTYGQST